MSESNIFQPDQYFRLAFDCLDRVLQNKTGDDAVTVPALQLNYVLREIEQVAKNLVLRLSDGNYEIEWGSVAGILGVNDTGNMTAEEFSSWLAHEAQPKTMKLDGSNDNTCIDCDGTIRYMGHVQGWAHV